MQTFTLVLVLQGNVATKLSYGGKFLHSCYEPLLSDSDIENLKNRPTFAKVTVKIKVAVILTVYFQQQHTSNLIQLVKNFLPWPRWSTKQILVVPVASTCVWVVTTFQFASHLQCSNTHQSVYCHRSSHFTLVWFWFTFSTPTIN